ncbi:hypothetical protein TNCV_5108451 [Trichonephila clavipes]|nr:hypothetical protein TNCV_5108451 [Trichonephila clavipes]
MHFDNSRQNKGRPKKNYRKKSSIQIYWILVFKTPPNSTQFRDSDCCAVGHGMGSHPGETMDVCKCIEPMRHGDTNYSSSLKSSRVTRKTGREATILDSIPTTANAARRDLMAPSSAWHNYPDIKLVPIKN